MICCPQKIIKSPLRYPGGKGAFFTYIAEIMKYNELCGGRYFEPFAGGAGVALALLSSNIASDVVLNDADYHIYCFWASILNENERFINTIWNTNLSITEWYKQKTIYDESEKYSVFEVGFSAFFLNRCNRSGILAGAGPIGGYEQKGSWRLDARFNKNDLTNRIADIGALKNRILVSNRDAIEFLTEYLPRERENALVYVDPPYVSAGKRLYLNLYSSEDHRNLADYLLRQVNLKWIMTYDDNTLIRELYSPCQKWVYNLGYSLQSKQKGKELLIAPRYIQLPDKDMFSSKKWHIIQEA